MGKRDKSKKKRDAEAASRKSQQKLEKKLKKIEKITGEPTIEELLLNFQNAQKKLTDVIITAVDHPSPRSHFTLVSSPDSRELIMFGGEYYNGKKVQMYSDLFIYQCKEHKWLLVNSSVTPPPRSGHQAIYIKSNSVPASIWLFGGEFSSPSQSRFHHYNDLWCLRIRTRKWELISSSGPCPRSGHRMLFMKNSILLFGGFRDTGSKTVYFNDLWKFDLSSSQWTQLTLTGDIPSPRSACLLFPSSDQRYCFIVGGYCKTSITSDVEKGVAYSDVLRLTIEKDTTHVHCVSIRPCGTRPRPPRSSMVGVTYGTNRAIIFGGVHDVESEDGEVFKSYFHNELLELELDKAKWHYFNYSNLTEVTTGSNKCSDLNLDHVHVSNCSTNVKLSDNLTNMTVGQYNTKTITCASSNKGDSICASNFLLPSPRASASMALMGSNLYILGGIFEVGDRKITMDDFYCLDLNHPTSWACLHSGTQESQEWLETDSDDDDDDVQSSETDQMDVDEEVSDDEELVENAPSVQSCETFTGYWNRTKQFWCELAIKGLDNNHRVGHYGENSCQPSTSGTVVPNLAKKLAKDFYESQC